MNWAKNFLIFSLFVLGISVIYFIVTSYRLPHLVEQEVGLAPHEEEASEMSYIHNRYVFSAKTDQSNEESFVVENEDDSKTASDGSVDSILDSLTDDSELESVSEDIVDALSPELKLKAERYAKLAQILPVVQELKARKFDLAKQREKYIAEDNEKRRRQGPPYLEPDPAMEEAYQKTVKTIEEQVDEYYRQIDNIFPELSVTYKVQGLDGELLILEERILRKYFNNKLPFDGNSDYFSSN